MKSFLLTKTRARNGSRCFIAVIASLLVLTYSAFSNTAVYADTAYWAYSVSVSSELGSKTAYYVTDNMQNTSVSNGKVVYCFNAEKHSPKAATSNSLVRYSRVVGDNDVYLRYVSKPLNSQSLEKDLLNVLYKGYPNNGTGIQEKYDLSDAAFRSLTQEAVWAVTDSIKKYDAVRTQNSDLNSRANEAYKELLETETSVLARDALDSEVTLEFFISSQCDFQNLVGVEFKTAEQITDSEPEEPTPGDDDNTGSDTSDNPDDTTGGGTTDSTDDNTGGDTSDNPDDTTGGGTTDSTGDNTGGELTDNPDAATGDGSNFGVGDGSGADSNIHATNAAVSSDDDSSTNLDNRDDFPKTGDNAPLVIYTVLLLSSALGALPLIKKKLKG